MSTSSWSSARAPALLPVFSALMFFVGFEMGGFQLALRGISGEFAVGAVGGGLLVAAQYVSIIFMPLMFGRLSDRTGKRRVLLVFLLVFCGGCVLAACSRSVPLFAAGVFCIGAGYSVCESTGSAALADASPENGSRWVNLSQGALSLGAVFSPILLQLGTGVFGWSWRAVFWICFAGALVSLVPLLLIRFPVRTVEVERLAVQSLRKVLSDPVFVLFFCTILLYVGLENGFGYFTESLFALRLNAASFGAYAISAYWASMALSRLVFGVLSVKPERALVLCLFAAAALFAALALLRLPALALASAALIGFSFGPVWANLMNLAARRHPGGSGGAMGLMSAGCGLGGAVFPALMGFVSDRFNLRAAFLLLAFAALAAGAISLLAARRSRLDSFRTGEEAPDALSRD